MFSYFPPKKKTKKTKKNKPKWAIYLYIYIYNGSSGVLIIQIFWLNMWLKYLQRLFYNHWPSPLMRKCSSSLTRIKSTSWKKVVRMVPVREGGGGGSWERQKMDLRSASWCRAGSQTPRGQVPKRVFHKTCKERKEWRRHTGSPITAGRADFVFRSTLCSAELQVH